MVYQLPFYEDGKFISTEDHDKHPNKHWWIVEGVGLFASRSYALQHAPRGLASLSCHMIRAHAEAHWQRICAEQDRLANEEEHAEHLHGADQERHIRTHERAVQLALADQELARELLEIDEDHERRRAYHATGDAHFEAQLEAHKNKTVRVIDQFQEDLQRRPPPVLPDTRPRRGAAQSEREIVPDSEEGMDSTLSAPSTDPSPVKSDVQEPRHPFVNPKPRNALSIMSEPRNHGVKREPGDTIAFVKPELRNTHNSHIKPKPRDHHVKPEPHDRRIKLEPHDRRIKLEPHDRHVKTELGDAFAIVEPQPRDRRVKPKPHDRHVKPSPGDTFAAIGLQPRDRRVKPQPGNALAFVEPQLRDNHTKPEAGNALAFVEPQPRDHRAKPEAGEPCNIFTFTEPQLDVQDSRVKPEPSRCSARVERAAPAFVSDDDSPSPPHGGRTLRVEQPTPLFDSDEEVPAKRSTPTATYTNSIRSMRLTPLPSATTPAHRAMSVYAAPTSPSPASRPASTRPAPVGAASPVPPSQPPPRAGHVTAPLARLPPHAAAAYDTASGPSTSSAAARGTPALPSPTAAAPTRKRAASQEAPLPLVFIDSTPSSPDNSTISHSVSSVSSLSVSTSSPTVTSNQPGKRQKVVLPTTPIISHMESASAPRRTPGSSSLQPIIFVNQNTGATYRS
ncbi:hypothetical protein K438DRAFT_1970396 [Mycena galopus ATCC 62051]|nr:hypothetical protein K438DRAFT_1970396 [Mycena galopus ATCC 62051]